MPIIIENITDVPTSKGSNKYRIRVNEKVIAEFNHIREEGISECLRRAAEACEDPKNIEKAAEMEMISMLLDYSFCKHGRLRGSCKLGEKDCD